MQVLIISYEDCLSPWGIFASTFIFTESATIGPYFTYLSALLLGSGAFRA